MTSSCCIVGMCDRLSTPCVTWDTYSIPGPCCLACVLCCEQLDVGRGRHGYGILAGWYAMHTVDNAWCRSGCYLSCQLGFTDAPYVLDAANRVGREVDAIVHQQVLHSSEIAMLEPSLTNTRTMSWVTALESSCIFLQTIEVLLACSILTPHTESHSAVEAQMITFFSSLDCRLN